MSELARRLLADPQAGLRHDASGRRFFRQRRVRFQTIRMTAADLRDGRWLEFDSPLDALAWSRDPSHRDIVHFAHEASRRYLSFWYRVFDVAVARALFGRDAAIFRTPFFEGSPLIDIGTPVEQSESSVPPALHETILAEYRRSCEFQSHARIYYLSTYLSGLTDDLIEFFKPYERLWSLKDESARLLEEIDLISARIEAPLRAALPDQPDRSLRAWLTAEADQRILERLDALARERGERRIAEEKLRKLIFRRRNGELIALNEEERRLCLSNGRALQTPAWLQAWFALESDAARAAQRARSGAGYARALFRIELRQLKLRRYQTNPAAPQSASALEGRARLYRERFGTRLAELAAAPGGDALRDRLWGGLAALLEAPDDAARLARLEAGVWPEAHSNPPASLADASSADAPARGIRAEFARYQKVLADLRATDQQILALHQTSVASSEDHPPVATTQGQNLERYPGLESIELDEGERPGDPFAEAALLRKARALLVRRLRPIRRTASAYSVIAGSRHGAMPLNPIMRLWKDRPEIRREGPRLTRTELNTRETVDCLLRLAALADVKLPLRELRREKTVREKRGPESLANLALFILPGSCYPLREIRRADFPEFRGRVIGETRTPDELGVPSEEDSVLTGAWYQKFNHALYYPAGGDHARLIRCIWDSARAASLPAFFFALGQFVHDCLPDNQIYYESGEKTFRSCVEEYYREEERVQKNRGEKTGRRRTDNSRAGVRFMFAVHYARLVLEALTGSSQSRFRHAATEHWLHKHVGAPLLRSADRATFLEIRRRARDIIAEY